MKTLIASIAVLAALPAGAAITLTGNSSSVSKTGLIPQAGAPYDGEKADNTQVGPSAWRNFYYDANGDLAFNAADGDTYGNTNASLALNVTINIATVLDFYVDNDGKTTIGENFDGGYYRLNGLTITLSDSSTFGLNVTQGTPQTFTDTDGTDWSVSLDGAGYLTGSPIDIVDNIKSTPSGDGKADYHFTLTFTEVPEPASSSALLLGLACAVFFFRRR